MVGQYMAHILGLGHLLKPGNIRSALRSIYRYNFKRDLYDHHPNVMRTFALNDESATLICTWPKGDRPKRPFPYFSEAMTGFEYQFAVHMIYEDMVEEGIEVIESIRRRYDGLRRNPWNEAECGNHYARAMASWGAIPALSGYRYSGVEKMIRFAPKINVVKVAGRYEVNPIYGGPECETVAALGSCCGIDDLEAIAYANQLCAAYGLDTISTGNAIAWAMECFERGLLTTEDTSGLELRFGDAEAMVTLVEQIAHREGFGDLLAEGTLRAAQRIGIPNNDKIRQPIAFPIFGRGRVLCALVGDEIKKENVEEICYFLVGGCSCQVKEANPGWDLLLSADWDGMLEGQMEEAVFAGPATVVKGGGAGLPWRNILIALSSLLVLVAGTTYVILWRRRRYERGDQGRRSS